ncbi:tetratricopeptide-like helical domain containing protein [Tanacetum coccineum]
MPIILPYEMHVEKTIKERKTIIFMGQSSGGPLQMVATDAKPVKIVATVEEADDYFKRASIVEPKDAEAFKKYASFLWQCRNDLWAAKETYLEAISADPNNSFYAAKYAHFLKSTGCEDTCFPFDALKN